MKKLVLTFVLALLVAPAAALADEPTPTDQQNAAKRCAALRTAMGETNFKTTYGTNANKSNAFGKCVSKLAGEEAEDRDEASQACTAERDDANFAASHGGKTFTQFYGTGPKGANAFGKCVSSQAKAASTEEQQATVNAAKQCRTEQKADPAAFKTKYGTNASKSNAFGKCVSAKAKAQQD